MLKTEMIDDIRLLVSRFLNTLDYEYNDVERALLMEFLDDIENLIK